VFSLLIEDIHDFSDEEAVLLAAAPAGTSGAFT
jgi:hypothetical protein